MESVQGIQQEFHAEIEGFHKQMKGELEINNKNLKSLFSGIDQKFNSLMKLMAKEKNMLIEDSMQDNRTPLLPTPPLHQRLVQEGKSIAILIMEKPSNP